MTDSERTGPSTDDLMSAMKEARELIRQLEGTTIQRFAVQAGEYRIEVERGVGTVVAGTGAGPQAVTSGTADGAAAQEADHRIPVKSPLVGTFYSSPEPGAKAFVEVGDTVDAGQTLCIVEAMKIMNQVQAEKPGRVAEMLLNDGDWVEFQQVLMYLEPLES